MKRVHSPDLAAAQSRLNRRDFLTKGSMGLGALALGSLFGTTLNARPTEQQILKSVLPGLPHFAPRAKRVVFLFQSGGPSQFETFDYKPKLNDMFGEELPASVRKGQRLTGMSAEQSSLPIAPSLYKFDQYGQSRAWVSELMPHTAQVVDELCFIKSMHTEQMALAR